LETFVNRRGEIRDGVTASRTTHRIQSERVVIAIVSTVVSTVVAVVVATTIVVAAAVATTIVVTAAVAAAVGAFGSLLLGHLIPNVKVVIISSGGRP
jgi:hypothetical protein